MPQPGRRNAPETQAAAIVQQLRAAGVDLADVRDNLAAAMRNEPVGFSVDAVRILNIHFPTLFQVGLSADNPLAAALHRTLSRSAAAPGANTSLMGRLAGSGIDMSRLAAAIDTAVHNGRDLPEAMRGVLRRAGIETHIGTRQVPMNHPLLQLRREIHAATPEEREPSPPRAQRTPRTLRRPRLGIPIGETSRPSGPDPLNARAGLAMPDRAANESNAQYAWRLHNLNPRASLETIAAATVGPSGHLNLRPTLNALNAMAKQREKIVAAFSRLRPISKADAERMGFKDGATHSEDEATDCLFGEPLSSANRNQRIIGLAQLPSDRKQAYSADINKDVVFMDLNRLADHLASKPEHPINRLQLSAENIRNFAFRIE